MSESYRGMVARPMREEEKKFISNLSPETQESISKLESESTEILRKRLELMSFVKEFQPFFTGFAGKDLVKQLVEGEDEQKEIRSKIDRKKVEAYAKLDLQLQQMPNDPDSLYEETEACLLIIEARARRAIELYQSMEHAGGLFENQLTGEKSHEMKEGERFYDMRWREFQRAILKLRKLGSELSTQERIRDRAMSRIGKVRMNGRGIEAITEPVETKKKTIKEFIESSPEAYLVDRMKRLKQLKETFDANGRIVETPYVLEKIQRVTQYTKERRPVFIHGELGSGKTELAFHISRSKLSVPHLQRWESANPKPEAPSDILKWQERREKEQEPLFVSGHKGLEMSELIASKAIKMKEVPLPNEQVRMIEEGWKAYVEESIMEAQAQNASGEELEILKMEIEKQKELYIKAKQEAFRAPVETRTLLGSVVQAMKEGRPVIIDEMNAIPHHTLIMMNDLLNRRPGERVSLPYADIDSFLVQEGFAVLATGNYKPEDGERYVGRQKIDSAFLSRFGIVAYDYLPSPVLMEAEGLSPEEQRKYRESNELFHMFVARLLESDLSADIPEHAFDQLKKLAFVMRNVQDVFSEKDVSSAFGKTTVNHKEMDSKRVLQENVPSLRHMLPILDRWRSGKYQQSLDELIFHDYILRSSARPAELSYLYTMFKVQGDFFSDKSGWPNTSESAQNLIDFKVPVYSPDQMKRFTVQEIVEQLYGKAPERTYVTSEFIPDESTSNVDDHLEAEDSTEMLITLQRLKDAEVDFTEVLADKGD